MKYAVISCDSNPEYYSLIPIVAYSWHKLGYTPVVIVVNCSMPLINLLTKYCPAGTIFRSLPPVEGVRDGTIAQFARLFIASEVGNHHDIIVTGDGDMIIMSDIFKSYAPNVTSFGSDLTGRTCLPICYVKADVYHWQTLMKIDTRIPLTGNISRWLPSDAYSLVWELYWDVDQDVLLERAKEYGFDKIFFVDRGFSGPVAANRWDRYNWDVVPDDIIDVHCIRGIHRWPEITAMAEYLFPGEVGWMGALKQYIDAL